MPFKIRYAELSQENVINGRYPDIIDRIEKHLGTIDTKQSEVDQDEFDKIASLHTDVWIEYSAHHAKLYTNQNRPNLYRSVPISSFNFSNKEFKPSRLRGLSGHVTGVIGEALFAWILHNEFNMNEKNFVHLRPIKGNGATPDFLIYNPKQEFKDKFGNMDLEFIPAEVKSVSNPDHSNKKKAIEKAIKQLRSHWKNMQGIDHQVGVICLAIKNDSEKTYDVVLIWCLS